MPIPMGLLIANAAAHAVEFVGLPEARINLAHAVAYLASAPKSNAAYAALNKAMADVEAEKAFPVPPHLRDARSGTGRGQTSGYLYPHDYEGSWVEQTYLPEGMTRRVYYEPTDNGKEAVIKARLDARRNTSPD